MISSIIELGKEGDRLFVDPLGVTWSVPINSRKLNIMRAAEAIMSCNNSRRVATNALSMLKSRIKNFADSN